MLRLYDAASRRTGPVRPARPGALVTWVAADGSSTADPAAASVIQPADLRSCLVADLVRRVAERHRLLVSTWHQASGADTGAGLGADTGAGLGADRDQAGLDPAASYQRALRAAWDELNIHPAEFSARPPDPLDVAITRADRPAGSPAHWVQPGVVSPGTPDIAGLDPLALRLTFIQHGYREPVALTRDMLQTADQTLRRWRGLVADWARSPSKPMGAQHVADVLGALDDDLDSPAALRALQALAADTGVLPGAKFEAFAYLDRLLGLDLAREVGR